MDTNSFRTAVEKGIFTGDWEDLEAWKSRESSFSFNNGVPSGTTAFDERAFMFILSLLARDDFYSASDSFNVFHVIECDWSLLTQYQKDLLLPLLVTTYSKFRDPMSWFMISEILGEYYGGETGLQALVSLKRVEDEGPRSLVPMGLDHIIRETSDKRTAEVAYKELIDMKDDPSEKVRNEVRESLGRVAAKDPHSIGEAIY